MFIIELVYKADLAAIDARMAAHVTFLKKYYASGNFLISGRKVPRDGGIILAVGKSRQDIEAIIVKDPFYVHGLADFRIVEFRASQRAEGMPPDPFQSRPVTRILSLQNRRPVPSPEAE
jgi:uncharacterized protein YciI